VSVRTRIDVIHQWGHINHFQFFFLEFHGLSTLTNFKFCAQESAMPKQFEEKKVQ
jgi:hypothetical protein